MPRIKAKTVADSGSSPSMESSARSTPPERVPKAKKEEKKKLTKRQAQKAAAEKITGKVEGNSVAAWITRINKSQKYAGVVQVGFASQLNTPYNLRRPTGVPALDIALGGGFHAGGFVQIHGPESVGKTFLAYRTAGMLQRNYGNRARIIIVPTEILPDKTFARKAGFCVAYSPEEIGLFNQKRLERGLPPFTADEIADLQMEIGEIGYAVGSTGDKPLDALVDALEMGVPDIVIVESLGAFLTEDQAAGDVSDKVYGGSAGILTNFVNKVYPFFMMKRQDGSMLESTIIAINQARAEIGGSPRGPKTHAAAGAYAVKHALLADVELHKSSPIKGSENGPIIGREVRWEITKGKAGTHDGKKGVYNYYHVPDDDPVFWSKVQADGLSWGIDVLTDLVEESTRLGVIEVAGSWLTWAEDETVIARCQGSQKMVETLASDPELEQKLLERCLFVANLPVRYK